MDASLALLYAAGAVEAELDPVRGHLSWRDRQGRLVGSASGAIVLSWWQATGQMRWAMHDPELRARGLAMVPALDPQQPPGPTDESTCTDLAASAALELGYTELVKVREGGALRFVAAADLELHRGLATLSERLRALALALRAGISAGDAAWRLDALALDMAARAQGAQGLEALVLRSLVSGLEVQARAVGRDGLGREGLGRDAAAVASGLEEAALGLDGEGAPDLGAPEGLLGAIALWMRAGSEDEDLARVLRQHLEDLSLDPQAEHRMDALLDAARAAGVPFEHLAAALQRLLPPGSSATALWRAVAATAPAKAQVVTLFNLGLALQGEGGAAPEAVALLARASDLDPSDPEVWFELGKAHEANGDEEGALAAWAQASRRAPAMAGPWVQRGRLLAHQGRLEEARQARARAAELADSPETWLDYGRAELAVGDPLAGRLALQRAELGFTRRLDLGLDSAAQHFWRGATRGALGDVDGALADLAQAVAADPALALRARGEEAWSVLAHQARFLALTAGEAAEDQAPGARLPKR